MMDISRQTLLSLDNKLEKRKQQSEDLYVDSLISAEDEEILQSITEAQ